MQSQTPCNNVTLTLVLQPLSLNLACWLRGQGLSPAVLRFGNGVGASLAVVLSHIFTLLERSSLVFKNMPDAEGIAVESALLAELGAVRAQWLIVHLREVYVFALIHHVTLVLENIS